MTSIYHTRCYLRDNTTMLNTNWKLHNQEEKYNALLQSAADVVIEMNTHGIYDFNMNSQLEKGYITKFNSAAGKKLPIQLHDCFFNHLNKDCEHVKDQFEKALGDQNIQFEFQDENLCSYSASFIPIATKESISHGNHKENQWYYIHISIPYISVYFWLLTILPIIYEPRKRLRLVSVNVLNFCLKSATRFEHQW